MFMPGNGWKVRGHVFELGLLQYEDIFQEQGDCRGKVYREVLACLLQRGGEKKLMYLKSLEMLTIATKCHGGGKTSMQRN